MNNSAGEWVVQAKGVVKTFVDGNSRVEVLQGIDFFAEKGQSVAVLGASGSGKSTLLHLLGGLDKPTQGSICIAGKAWSELNENIIGNILSMNLDELYEKNLKYYNDILSEKAVAEYIFKNLTV